VGLGSRKSSNSPAHRVSPGLVGFLTAPSLCRLLKGRSSAAPLRRARTRRSRATQQFPPPRCLLLKAWEPRGGGTCRESSRFGPRRTTSSTST
jgi:hypothetical protein